MAICSPATLCTALMKRRMTDCCSKCLPADLSRKHQQMLQVFAVAVSWIILIHVELACAVFRNGRCHQEKVPGSQLPHKSFDGLLLFWAFSRFVQP